jgi:hypothetical protein
MSNAMRSVGIHGQVAAALPVCVETIRLDNPAVGAVSQGQTLRVRLDRIQPLPSAQQSERYA